MKLISVVGARPQFIKASILIKELQKKEGCEHILIHTGQHYDKNMSEIFFYELGIQIPKYNLEVGSEKHGAQTGEMLDKLESVFIDEKPDWVIVYGDTNSTLAAALAASKIHIPVAHVEAGLRSFNKDMPEELNRVLVDHLSSMLLAPTEISVKNLINEGFNEKDIHLVGDVMYDSVLHYKDKLENNSSSEINIPYILATVHRAENTDDEGKLTNIFKALVTMSEKMTVIVPMHPRTRTALEKIGLISEVERKLKVMSPLSYFDLLKYQKNACLVVTDSGGIQKEAFFLKVPCVTLRDETEWCELVERGCNILVSPVKNEIILQTINSVIKNKDVLIEKDIWQGLYGDGKACHKIANLLIN